MFDKEIIKNELEPCVKGLDIDLDEVVENYTMIDGFYCFRINYDGYLFNNNQLIDSLPGYFAKEGEGVGDR